MPLLFAEDEIVAAYVGAFLGKPFHPPYSTIGVLDRAGTISGGFVFTSFTGPSIELSLAGGGVVHRGTWRAVLHYAFDQLGCVRLQAHTARKNPTRKMLTRLGFAFEGTSRRLFGDQDGLCYSLTAEDLPKFRERWRL